MPHSSQSQLFRGTPLKVEISHTSSVKKEFNIEVPVERVVQTFNMVFAQFSKNAPVPGFRPGKAPLSMIRTRFGSEARDRVMRMLLPEAIYSAIEESKLKVIGEPSVDDVLLNDGLPMKVKVSVEVLPEFEVGDFGGLKAVKKLREVNDETVDSAINAAREQKAALTPIEEDRAAAEGDVAEITLAGYILAEGAEGPAEDAVPDIPEHPEDVELGKPTVLAVFNENLVGMKVGDTRIFETVFGDERVPEDLKGKRVSFKATLDGLKKKELPELDDEFVKGLPGGFESLADLKTKLKERFEKEADREATDRVDTELLDQLVDRFNLEVPDLLVRERINERLREMAMNFYEQGIDPRAAQLDWQSLGDSLKPAAIRDIQRSLVLEQIGEEAKIEVPESDVDREIEVLAKQTNQPAAAVKARLTSEKRLDSIRAVLRNQKALQLLRDAAHIDTEVVSPTMAAQDPSASSPSE